jgi:hypothetical protein
MRDFQRIAIAGALMSLMALGVANAQQPAPNTSPMSATTANPKLQRQLSAERRALNKQKRASCERQASEQKLRAGNRWRFVRQCLRG